MALVQNSTHAGGHVIGHSTMYAGVADAPAIESLLHRANELVSTSATQQSNSHHSIQVSAAYDDELLGLLKNIKQYQSSSVHLSFQDVKIDQILFLTRYVKSYKYNQIGKIFDLYHETESNFFECLAIDYGSTRMFVAPPVLERHGNYYYLIEGNSRLTYCIKELKLSVIRAVVVENVSHPLPTTGRYPIGKVMISDTNKIGTERYDKFNISEFRWVEEAVRHPSTFI